MGGSKIAIDWWIYKKWSSCSPVLWLRFSRGMQMNDKSKHYHEKTNRINYFSKGKFGEEKKKNVRRPVSVKLFVALLQRLRSYLRACIQFQTYLSFIWLQWRLMKVQVVGQHLCWKILFVRLVCLWGSTRLRMFRKEFFMLKGRTKRNRRK